MGRRILKFAPVGARQEILDDDDDPTEEDEYEEDRLTLLKIEALKHVWSYYTHHDVIRVNFFRFFLLIYGALAAALVQPSIIKVPFVAAIVAWFACFATTIFKRLDARSRQLIDSSRFALKALQKDLGDRLDLPAMQIVELNEKTDGIGHRFNFLMPLFFSVLQVLSLFAFVLLFVRSYRENTTPMSAAEHAARCQYSFVRNLLDGELADTLRQDLKAIGIDAPPKCPAVTRKSF